MKDGISARRLLAVLFAFVVTGVVSAQEPAFLQGSAGVRYEEAPGVFHYVFPCNLSSTAGDAATSSAQAASGAAALCWLAVVTPVEMVDGKAKAGAPVPGALMVSAERVHFLPNDSKTATPLADFVPSQAASQYDAKHSVLGLQTKAGLFVVALRPVCLGCASGNPLLDPSKAAQVEAEYAEMQSSLKNFDAVSKRIKELADHMRFGVTPKDQPSLTDVPEAMVLYSDLNHRLAPLCPEASRACVESYERYQACKSGNLQADCGVAPSCSAYCPLLADAWRSLKATFCRSPKLDYAALVPDWTPVALKMDAARGPVDPAKIHPVSSPAGAQLDFMGKPVDPESPCSVEGSYALAMMSHMSTAVRTQGPSQSGVGGGVMGGVLTGREAGTYEVGKAPKVGKVVVSAGAMAGNMLVKTTPQYPPVAKAARIEGTVVLQASISKEGSVEDLQVLSGPPLLQQSALDAVKTWKYRPYLLNGEAVAVGTTINVVFALGISPATAPMTQVAKPPQ